MQCDQVAREIVFLDFEKKMPEVKNLAEFLQLWLRLKRSGPGHIVQGLFTKLPAA